MPRYIFEGKYSSNTGIVEVKLLLFHFKDENKVHFIYSPNLDLTGYGSTESAAKESFEIVLSDFIDYTIKKKTLSKVLQDLGWEIKGSEKRPKKLLAPGMSDVIKNQQYVSEIFDKYRVKSFHQTVEMPCVA